VLCYGQLRCERQPYYRKSQEVYFKSTFTTPSPEILACFSNLRGERCRLRVYVLFALSNRIVCTCLHMIGLSFQASRHKMCYYPKVSVISRDTDCSNVPGHTAALSSMYAVTCKILLPYPELSPPGNLCAAALIAAGPRLESS
jgi:hypothetical protein